MSNPTTLRRITPDQLDEILAQVQQAKQRELVLLGPGLSLPESPHNWPDELKSRSVFQLTEPVQGLAARLLHLDQLTSLNLNFNSIGEAGATAIAEHLTGLTSLYLGGNSIGEAGATAIAEHLTGLRSLDSWNDNIRPKAASWPQHRWRRDKRASD